MRSPHIDRGTADAILRDLRYIAEREVDGKVWYGHPEEPSLALAIDFSNGSLSVEAFCFVLEHHMLEMEAVHAILEAMGIPVSSN